MNKSGCVIVFLFVALCASMFGNLILLALVGVQGAPQVAAARILRERHFEEISVQHGKGTGSRIVEIPLEGIIAAGQSTSLGSDLVRDFKQALEQARNDDSVKAVVISVDSPGGEITASDVLYNALKDFSTNKPTVVYFNSIGASGAYYAACGGTKIMCNATTFTGSIGVIISTLNYQSLFGKIGLEAVVFKSGKFKDMLSGSREMTPEERQYVEDLVMQGYERFLGIVAEARSLDPAQLRDGPADGRILSGSDAFDAKLVDQIGYIEDAYQAARELANAPGASIIRYRRNASFSDIFSLLGEAKTPEIRLGVLPERPPLEPGRLYLLPSTFFDF
jgi:protease IV